MVSFNRETTGDEVVKAFSDRVKGKTVLVTGPSQSGIGAQATIFLAAGKPKHILLAGRSESRIRPVMDEISKTHPDVLTTYVKLDLADNASVRQAARAVNGQIEKLDILINNAGVMAIKDYTTSADGIEMQLAANHVGHFLLTRLLMDKILLAGQGSRIVYVSSLGYMSGGIRVDDYNFRNGEVYNPWLAYAQSKTANILTAAHLAKMLKPKGVSVFAVNPGLILDSQLMTSVTPEMFAEGAAVAQEALKGAEMPPSALTPKPLASGTSTTLYAALDPSLDSHSGSFLNDCTIFPDPLQPHAVGEENEKQLWALSEKLIGEKFTVV